jgi:murein DD-endopeptidase MepM/ murein hydrolase activator NlpD
LKRTFTQKVKKVPTCAADSFEALLKLYVGYLKKQPVGATIPTDAHNRRARTSAAMIGLAISMGTAGLLLPRQGDEALAVEPVAETPTLPNLPARAEASVSSASALEPEVVASATPSVSAAKPQAALKSKSARKPVVEHQVKRGETLWELSKAYEVQPEAIAVSNEIRPDAVLPVGQRLKIPTKNGIVHEVKPGETVKTLSESYGVEPTELHTNAPVSELGQIQTGASVTVPGNVNDLLKARQDVALKRLQEHRNRLNDSLAELGSEESTNLSQSATLPLAEAVEAQDANSVRLPSGVLKAQEPLAIPQPVATALATPIVIPVPTPEMMVAPKATPKAAMPEETPVVIPVPTPEMAASPTVAPKTAMPEETPVVIPVPTPEMAASPTVAPKTAMPEQTPVVIPVPTPEIAASPTVTPRGLTVPTLKTAPADNSEHAAKPQTSEVPQPVFIEPIGSATPTSSVYQVKPGDTLDAIARRNGLSRTALMQANGLTNPHLIRANQPLKIPQTQPSIAANRTVALFPGINPKSDRSATGQEQQSVRVPTPAVPIQPEPVQTIASAAPSTSLASAPRISLAEATEREGSKPSSYQVADNKPSQSSDSNPYVEKLKADILRLREEYRQQRTQEQASASVVVPTVSSEAASSLKNPSTSNRPNPEFDPKKPDEGLQARRKRQVTEDPQGSIPIEVPPPETTALTPAPRRVAAAPAPAGSYNPSLRTPVGQTVSPELPSLSAPDMYLPDSPTQFEGYIWPAKGVLTSGYGRRWGRMHKGIDIAAPVGTPIVAAAPGVVVTAGWNSGGYGNLVEVQHPDGSLTLYAHNNKILVRRGQAVEQGQQISEMGSTGYSTGPHLHFEVHPSGRGAVNPIAYLPPRSKR